MKFLKQFFEGKPKIQKIDLTRRFDLINRVGQGSMSKVWRARDTKTGMMVAVKVLDKEKTDKLESRFGNLQKPSEGEIAVQLQHPNIVRTFEFGYTKENEQFLVMEFVEGVSLSYLVDTQNEVMQKYRLRLIIELGEAIEHFHKEKWIHRDICPRNVMVTEDHHIKLIDFGLVVPNTAEFQKPGNRTGTASYMAPELVKRQKTDQRIDIFSYAVTCFEMFANRLPWEGAKTADTMKQVLNKPPADLRELVPDIDDDIVATILKGLEREPADRWSSVNKMIERFRDAQQRLRAAV